MKYKAIKTNSELLNQVFEFYTSKATNPIYFEEIKEYCNDHVLLKRIHNHSIYIGMGYLTRDDFLMFATDKKVVTDGVPTAIFDLILEVLTEQLILIKLEPNTLNNTHTLYQANESLAKYYYANDLLFNKLFGFNYIIEKYLPSVFKIEHYKNDNVSIGNGFLVKIDSELIIVTNKHVVENADKIIVKNLSEEIIEFSSIVESTSTDLAYITPTIALNSITPFKLKPNLNVLEEILTIGYPPIPTSKASYPLFHLGEVNSFVENYWGDSLFIFSAKTNPGNSGSPIIDKEGTAVGIITQQLEEQEWYIRSRIPYYAGIPSLKILEFLNEKKYLKK